MKKTVTNQTERSIEDIRDQELSEFGLYPSAESIAEELFLLTDIMHVLIAEAPQLAYASLLEMYGTDRMEFESKMLLKHNAADKAINRAQDIITAMLKDGIENVKIPTEKTQNDDYYRNEAQRLLKIIIKLRYS